MANVILFGKFLKETDIVSMETAETVFKKIIPQNKSWLVEKNIKALMLGKSFA
jgi:2-oxoglutarate ferredoxin oxidoreductase subunit gamma